MRGKNINIQFEQLSRQFGDLNSLRRRPSIYQDKILAFDVSELPQSVLETENIRVRAQSARKKSDADEPIRLLRARSKRPPHRAADDPEKFAPPHHSITTRSPRHGITAIDRD